VENLSTGIGDKSEVRISPLCIYEYLFMNTG